MTSVGEVSFDVLTDVEGPPTTAAETMYGRSLRFPTRPEPHVVANFVSTIDGVVSLGLNDGTDSSTVSGRQPGDRFMLAMLRAAADVVMVGAGTLRASVGHQWAVTSVAGSHLEALQEYRAELGRSSDPAPLVVVTGSGQLPSHVALTRPQTEPIVLTTAAGARNVAAAFPKVRTLVVGEARHIRGDDLVAALRRELGAGLVVCEGGPTLMGSLIAAGAADELFLTVAPWIAGRDPSHPRLGLVNDFVASPRALRTTALTSARRSGSHLFLRYRFGG
jgi:riboflavin biosynthesis pyrimidine reductase